MAAAVIMRRVDLFIGSTYWFWVSEPPRPAPCQQAARKGCSDGSVESVEIFPELSKGQFPRGYRHHAYPDWLEPVMFRGIYGTQGTRKPSGFT